MENVFTDYIIFSSVGVQASTRMQPIEPTYLATKWGVGLEAARHTLECTTQRVIWTVLHLFLIRNFRMNFRQLRYRWLQHDVFGDTLLTVTNSKRVNKYAEVFVTKFGWLRTFPVSKKGDSHEALYLLF